MKYRSRLDIVAAILRSMVETPSSKNRLMYSAFISYAQLKEYLPYLEERDLVRRDGGTQLYSLTKRGFDVPGLHEEIMRMIGENGVSSTGRAEEPVAPTWRGLGLPIVSASQDGFRRRQGEPSDPLASPSGAPW